MRRLTTNAFLTVGTACIFVDMLTMPLDIARIDTRDPAAAGRFANEVRRFYPFFPVISGTVRREFEWLGRRFEPGDRAILDLYATNHDRRIWDEPRRFLPERFESWDGDPNTLVPQGGGDAATGHRCPGEAATIAVRPERVHLSMDAPRGAENCIVGRIVDVAYHGQDVNVHLVVPGKRRLLARLPSSAAETLDLAPGARLVAHWDRKNSRIFDD